MSAIHTITGKSDDLQQAFSPVDFLKLGLIVIGVTAFSFAPFVYFVSLGLIKWDILSLFPSLLLYGTECRHAQKEWQMYT